MEEKMMDGCTGNCGTCGSACEGSERKPSFFDRLESISEHFEEIGEDNLIQMLNDVVTELEKEDEEDGSK